MHADCERPLKAELPSPHSEFCMTAELMRFFLYRCGVQAVVTTTIRLHFDGRSNNFTKVTILQHISAC